MMGFLQKWRITENAVLDAKWQDFLPYIICLWEASHGLDFALYSYSHTIYGWKFNLIYVVRFLFLLSVSEPVYKAVLTFLWRSCHGALEMTTMVLFIHCLVSNKCTFPIKSFLTVWKLFCPVRGIAYLRLLLALDLKNIHASQR